MAEPGEEEDAPPPEETGSKGGIRELLASLAGKFGPIAILSVAAAIFYIVGYVVASDVLRTTGLKGSIALKSEFYLEAGADFVADLVTAPLQAPVAFVLAFAFAFLLVPRKLLDRISKGVGHPVPAVEWVRLAALVALTLATYLVAMWWFEPFSQTMAARWLVRNLLDMGRSRDAQTSLGSLLFLLTLPVAAALISSALRLPRHPGSGAKPVRESRPRRGWMAMRKPAVGLAVVFYISMIPIAYGSDAYDWQMKKVAGGGAEQADLWYLRRVQDQAIFVHCDPVGYGIEVRNVDPSLRLDSSIQVGLRERRCGQSAGAGQSAEDLVKGLSE
jgi:hypothetical protein